jgi:predicted RNA polymerase sigma factor
VPAVVHLVFNEGYSATAGEDLLRPALCDEAMRLGRVLAALVPDGLLTRVVPSRVVELNRAVAVSMADGPAAALELVDALGGRLDRYHLLPTVRGDLLARPAGRGPGRVRAGRRTHRQRARA